MARTNIEEEAWARIYRLAEFRGCSAREAAGTAVCLWHQSQSLVKASGSAEEIVDWSGLHNVSEEDAQKWILALKKAMLISCLDNGQYRIHGNDIQIENTIKNVTRASKGGQALKKKLAELKRLKAGSKPAISGTQVAPRGPNQCNANQINATQFNSNQGNAKKEEPVSSKLTKASAFIAGYRERFLKRWSSKVNVEGKDAGIAKRVAERLSHNEIQDYLDAFFAMPDTELIKKRHPVFLFETKLTEIAVYAQTGKFTSHREAAQADESVALSSQLQRIREGRI